MLKSQSFDYKRICEILTKYNVDISNANSSISINRPKTNSTTDEKTENSDIILLQSFLKEIINEYSETSVNTEINSSMHDLKYSTVTRGEIYKCDFGNPYGSEQGYERYAIVVQCDIGNKHSPTTIVLACTTEVKSPMLVHFEIIFSNENMIDYDEQIVGNKKNTILAEQIRTVDKRRLREYVGKLKPKYMEQIDNIIEKSLSIKSRTIEKIVYVDVPIVKKEKSKLSITQMKILSYINIKELIKIIESHETNENKCPEILKLFGFDLKKNGVQYLENLIIKSLKYEQFNLETLTKMPDCNTDGVDSEELKRLMIARVKEVFKIKSCTLDFIRLINSFLVKGEI